MSLQQRTETKILKIPAGMIDKCERLMNLPEGHVELEDFPRYSTIKSWTVKFDTPGYEADIKICSSGDGEPLWSEAVLFRDGSEVAYTEPDDSLEGEWFLSRDDIEFTIIVERES